MQRSRRLLLVLMVKVRLLLLSMVTRLERRRLRLDRRIIAAAVQAGALVRGRTHRVMLQTAMLALVVVHTIVRHDRLYLDAVRHPAAVTVLV